MKYNNPYNHFHSDEYLLHNRSRHEHLDSLNIPLRNKSILEVGAGIGDHTEYLLNLKPRNILCLEARDDNIEIINNRFNENPSVKSRQFDMDNLGSLDEKFDVCYCYGLLYHLANPENAIEFMAAQTREILLLETCVDYVNEDIINQIDEDINLYSQSFSRTGCRPGRVWIFRKRKEHFNHVYIPLTQPKHSQFPTDWNHEVAPEGLSRAIFIASTIAIDNVNLSKEIPYSQAAINE